MQSASYYRQHAERAERLANAIEHPEARAALETMARDYHHIADDLERGLIDIPAPLLLPQRQIEQG